MLRSEKGNGTRFRGHPDMIVQSHRLCSGDEWNRTAGDIIGLRQWDRRYKVDTPGMMGSVGTKRKTKSNK